jgi:hypothetical protein
MTDFERALAFLGCNDMFLAHCSAAYNGGKCQWQGKHLRKRSCKRFQVLYPLLQRGINMSKLPREFILILNVQIILIGSEWYRIFYTRRTDSEGRGLRQAINEILR